MILNFLIKIKFRSNFLSYMWYIFYFLDLKEFWDLFWFVYVIYESMFRVEISFYDLNFIHIYDIYLYVWSKNYLKIKIYFSYKEFRSKNLDLRSKINVCTWEIGHG